MSVVVTTSQQQAVAGKDRSGTVASSVCSSGSAVIDESPGGHCRYFTKISSRQHLHECLRWRGRLLATCSRAPPVK